MDSQGGMLITQIKQLQDRIFERLLVENHLEINGSQGRILFVLWKKDHQSMSEISKATSLANNTLTSLIDRMVVQGLVIRQTNEQNRRQVFITLSDLSIQLKSRYETVSNQMNEIFYADFNETERRELEIQLARILQHLKDHISCEDKP